MASPTGVKPGSLVLVADYQPGATFGPRRLREHEFVWLLRGSAWWAVEEVAEAGRSPRRHEEFLRPGTLTLTPGGTIDSYRWDPNAVSTHAYLHFELDPASAPGAGWDWPRSRSLAAHPLLRGIVDQLLLLAARDDEASRRRSDQLVHLLWDSFVHDPLPRPEPAASPHITAAFAEAQRIWRREGIVIIGAARLAAAAGVSPSHLFRVFRGAYGCGPTRALELVRLARAAVALQRTDASLAEVARLYGFANAYHFSRRFAHTYGVPPGAYRALGTGADPLEPVRAAGLLEAVVPALSSLD